jgi:hypothetical protein
MSNRSNKIDNQVRNLNNNFMQNTFCYLTNRAKAVKAEAELSRMKKVQY